MNEELRKAVEKAFEDKELNHLYGYDEVVLTFADKILVESIDNEYQGSTYMLLRRGASFGYLEFGWGSCSGCDALQAVSSMDDLFELTEELYRSVTWMPSIRDVLHWCRSHDWKGSFGWNEDGLHDFIKQLNEKYDAGIDVAD